MRPDYFLAGCHFLYLLPTYEKAIRFLAFRNLAHFS